MSHIEIPPDHVVPETAAHIAPTTFQMEGTTAYTEDKKAHTEDATHHIEVVIAEEYVRAVHTAHVHSIHHIQ